MQQDGHLIRVKAGTKLVEENEISRKMYLIQKGKARVYKTYLNHKVTIAILGESEIFGELSFFDAQPRSASVEALTEMTVVEIDGDKASSQIEGLPSWVFSIMKQVFFRFREMDQKITVLQSMAEYRKKTFRHDNIGQAIYCELLRFIETMSLLYKKNLASSEIIKKEHFYDELDDLLGNRILGLKVFWKQLREFGIIDSVAEEHDGKVVIDQSALFEFKHFLDSELKSERYLLLKHSSLSLLRKMIGQHDQPGRLSLKALNNMPLFEEAKQELSDLKVVVPEGENLIYDPKVVATLYTQQSIIKAFDHTVVSLD